ncbi:MAG: helix-turn-helix transcriptional regulator [Anaerotignum sp.]|nr:helix-turn-helix transcriptional regulator [Anaerotignum sp.]MBR5794305.1 helix-turn-helix transcriptional regulator [Anaerotignum sp.]
MEFRERLKALRKEIGMTQIELGEKLNYGSTAIANYEAGRNQPSIPDLMKIASIFDVSMDYLLCVSDIRHPYAVSEETVAMHKFHQYYTQLNEESKKELFTYMRYLVYKQEDTPVKDKAYGEQEVKPILLKASQKSEEYK